MARYSKGISRPPDALGPVKWLRWAIRTPGVTRTIMRRGIALFLCLGVWVVAIFLIYDSSDRMMGEGQVGREMLTGVLTFPFSILVLVGALSLTVRLIRRWAVMREEFLPRPSDEEGNHPNEETEGFR